MTYVFIAAIIMVPCFTLKAKQSRRSYWNIIEDIDCKEDRIAVQGMCQNIINQQEVEKGGQLFVTCSARSLRLPYSDVAVLRLFHQGRQETVARMLASYSVTSPEANFTIASDPIRNWKISRSQRWSRQSESSNTLISRLQLAIYNFTPADVGEYICYSMDPWTCDCRCVGSVRMKGVMSTVNKTILEEGESFTVTCTLNTINLFPLKMPSRIFDIQLIQNKIMLLNAEESYQNQLINERSWKAWLGHVGMKYIDEQTFLKVEVTDAQCSDSGSFKCVAFYQSLDGIVNWVLCTYTDVVIKAPLSGFSFDVFSREQKLDFVEGETISMMCSIQGPKDVVFDWRFGRKQRNGEMLDYSYPHHRHIKTTATPLTRPGFENCPYYEHRSQLSFTAERRYNGYTFYCDVLTPGKLFRRRNATIFVQIPNAPGTEAPIE